MKQDPKVGIVIPSYERIDYLRQAVLSALNQTYGNLEIVIIDDCSPSKAVQEYLKKIDKHPKIKCFINKKNLGVTKNYDKGVKLLSKRVEWASILDNDDVLDKDFVAEAVKTHLQYPRSQIIFGRQIFINNKGEIIDKEETSLPKYTAEDYLFLRCLGKKEIRSSAIFFNINQFKKVGGYPLFPSGMTTDSVLPFALAFGNLLVSSFKARVYIRIHPQAESQTAFNIMAKLLSIKQMFNYCRQVYKDHPKIESKKQDKVFNYLGYYEKLLNSGLLVRKYTKIVSSQSKSSAKKKLQRLIRQCQENKIVLPPRFLFLSKAFIKWGVNLQEIGWYKIFISIVQRLNLLERSIRHFLLDKKDFFYSFKESCKKTSLGFYMASQINTIVDSLKKRIKILGFKYCLCCGYYSLFYWNKNYEHLLRKQVIKWRFGRKYTEQMVKRENEFCAHCGSNFRTRSHAKTVIRLLKFTKLPQFITFLKKNPSFIVYETANYWVFRHRKIKKLANYLVSEFHPDYPLGQLVNGIRNENLEELTFTNESFDLLITSEVLEHVSDLSRTLTEIYRVLKAKGYHVFTVPVDYSRKETRTRAKVIKNGKLKHLLPPVFHGDDISSGVLSYRDFGKDIEKIIGKYGFRRRQEKYYLRGKHITSVYISQKI